MSVQVIMPQLGESVIEGTISKWLKLKGERIEEFEPLLEVNTDKVDWRSLVQLRGFFLTSWSLKALQ